MLKSYEAIYDHGKLTWIGEEPALGKQRILVIVEDWESSKDAAAGKMVRRRQPSAKLRGTVQVDGDIVESLYRQEEWEAFSERTLRQLEGDPKAFE